MINKMPAEKVREYMCDIALMVSELTVKPIVSDVGVLQRRCLEILDKFDAALEAEHLPLGERQQAVYAAAALLDEVALKGFGEKDAEIWINSPLQVIRFSNYQAGEKIFQQIDTELSRAEPSQWLLSTWQVVLALGYKGKYIGHQGEITLDDLQNKFSGLVGSSLEKKLLSIADSTLKQKLIIDWLSYSPLLFAIVACAAAGVVYMVLKNLLKASVAGLI